MTITNAATEQVNNQDGETWLGFGYFFRRLAAESFEDAETCEDKHARQRYETYAVAYTAAYVACAQKGKAMQMPEDVAKAYLRLSPAVADALLEFAAGRHIAPEDLATLRAEELVEADRLHLTAKGAHYAEGIRHATD